MVWIILYCVLQFFITIFCILSDFISQVIRLRKGDANKFDLYGIGLVCTISFIPFINLFYAFFMLISLLDILSNRPISIIIDKLTKLIINYGKDVKN